MPLKTTKKISLLLPTRKRVERANAFLKSVVDTAACLEKIEVVAAVDDDDQESQALVSPHAKLLLRKAIGPRARMGELNTRCLREAKGDIIMLVNDDILIRSKDWDTHLRDADQLFSDGIYLFHVKDGFKNEKFPIFPILSKRFCDLIQDPYPAEFGGDGNDTHLYDIFLRLQDLGHERIIYLPDVFFEHMHYKLGKAENDAVYQSRCHLDGNKTFYNLWRYRESQVARIAAFINGDELTKISKESPNLNSFSQIFSCSLSSKQSLSYRMSYLAYHTAREIYLSLGLNRIKTWINILRNRKG